MARKKDFAQLISRVYDTAEYNSAKRGYPECYHEFVEKILKAKAKHLSKLSKFSQDMMNLTPFGQSSNDTSSTHFSNNNTIDENMASKNSSSSGYSSGCWNQCLFHAAFVSTELFWHEIGHCGS